VTLIGTGQHSSLLRLCAHRDAAGGDAQSNQRNLITDRARSDFSAGEVDALDDRRLAIVRGVHHALTRIARQCGVAIGRAATRAPGYLASRRLTVAKVF
jgi:hypothetical protein